MTTRSEARGAALPPTGRSRQGLAARAAAGAAAVLFAAAACSSGGGSDGGSATPTPPPGSGGNGTSAVTTVTVGETEYALHLSQSAFTPGHYQFVVDDQGHMQHSLAISGPGVNGQQTSTLDPGQSARLDVTLQPGTYQLWCPVDGHRELGMSTTITVAGTPAPSGTTSGGTGGGGGY